MKVAHLSDLHLGKRLNGFPLLDDQEYILEQIIDICDDKNIDAVIIAGDIYDKSVPPAEAVKLFDKFITELSERNLSTFIISGNHDSAERIAFGSRIMQARKFYFSPVYNGELTSATVTDEFGKVNFYLLPFVKPAVVRNIFNNDINDYTDAVRTAIANTSIDFSERNVLIAHQFVTGALRSDSEINPVGGLDNVDISVFDNFDYTALGHIHSPQSMSGKVRYCGSPLKYSFSEADHNKSVTIIELKEKGNIDISEIPLTPKHDIRILTGSYDELMSRNFYSSIEKEDYMKIILTDKTPIAYAINIMRDVYPNIMQLEYSFSSNSEFFIPESYESKKLSEIELASDFYSIRCGEEMTAEQSEIINQIIDRIKEGE